MNSADLKTPNIFTNPIDYLRETAERKAAETAPDSLGNRNPGFLNDLIGNLTGATDAGTQEYINRAKEVANRNKYQETIEALGGQYVRGKTAGQLQAQVSELQEDLKNSNFESSPAGKRLTAQLKQQSENNKITNKRLDEQITMGRLDRADRLDAQADALALERERMEREDHRYNQELMRFNENRRMESISGLAGGLAALAAAFAM
jgi:hypothetical protein